MRKEINHIKIKGWKKSKEIQEIGNKAREKQIIKERN